ncbi:MAG: TraR/DksA C4-type zinc finger protein [Verrucomicrobia bacterium]|nr:TraR/DksA C4-type zinc finger protein [Verrucomicrobiota bacterium]
MAKKSNKPAKPKAAKKPVAKKSAAKKPAAKAKPAPPKKKPAPAKKPVSKKPVAKKPAPKKPEPKKPAPKKPAAKAPAKPAPKKLPPIIIKKKPGKPVKLSGWVLKQRQRLLQLKDTLLDSMNGVGRDTLRSRAEGSEASAFGMHTGDAGSDAYDRDFALSLLSQERDSLFEIDAALKKIDEGNYGLCEMSGRPIPHVRLEALPFARYTIECQSELEKTNRLHRVRTPVTSLFGLNDEDGEDGEEESSTTESKE